MARVDLERAVGDSRPLHHGKAAVLLKDHAIGLVPRDGLGLPVDLHGREAPDAFESRLLVFGRNVVSRAHCGPKAEDQGDAGDRGKVYPSEFFH